MRHRGQNNTTTFAHQSLRLLLFVQYSTVVVAADCCIRKGFDSNPDLETEEGGLITAKSISIVPFRFQNRGSGI